MKKANQWIWWTLGIAVVLLGAWWLYNNRRKNQAASRVMYSNGAGPAGRWIPINPQTPNTINIGGNTYYYLTDNGKCGNILSISNMSYPSGAMSPLRQGSVLWNQIKDAIDKECGKTRVVPYTYYQPTILSVRDINAGNGAAGPRTVRG